MAKAIINQDIKYLKMTEIGSLLMMDRAIGLGSLANRTFGIFFQPFEDAFLMVNMLAFQPDNFLI